jgi:hypothetical protein
MLHENELGIIRIIKGDGDLSKIGILSDLSPERRRILANYHTKTYDKDSTFLTVAAMNGKIKPLKFLLDVGVSFIDRDGRGITTLEYLISHISGEEGREHSRLKGIQTNYYDPILKELLNKELLDKVSPEERRNYLGMALIKATTFCDIPVMEMILKAGADINFTIIADGNRLFPYRVAMGRLMYNEDGAAYTGDGMARTKAMEACKFMNLSHANPGGGEPTLNITTSPYRVGDRPSAVVTLIGKDVANLGIRDIGR